MHLVAGFELPTSGRVRVCGAQVTGPGADRGMVFQSDLALFPWLSVEQNVAFGLDLARRGAGEKAAIVERMPIQAGDVPATFANVDRAHRALGYAPSIRPEEGIRRFWDWYQSAS
jgi:ABC-type sugar transport system ATPase subunit